MSESLTPDEAATAYEPTTRAATTETRVRLTLSDLGIPGLGWRLVG